MCGVAGIIAREPAEQVVERMLGRLAHRGPDAQGLVVRRVRDRVATFGHRRLSIVDLDGGAQPMLEAGARALVTFNGEIYGHLALREELERLGHRFLTRHSDTETLAAGFARWGEGIAPRLTGMFAFAALDLASGEVLLARDRSGMKPLYFARLPSASFGGGVAFASELDALLEVPSIDRRVDLHGLSSYLFSDCTHPPHTLVRGVEKLGPGERLVVRADGSLDGPERYVSPELPEVSLGVDEPPTADELRETLADAVEAELMSDVPLGVFLSGGVDSSMIAALAKARGRGRSLTAFSIAFEEASFDESAHARRVALHLGLPYVEETLGTPRMLETLDTILDGLDEPMADPSIVPTYHLAALAARHVKAALGGDGADELFGGYPTYRAHAGPARLLGPPVLGARRIFGEARLAAWLDAIPASEGYQSLDWKLKRFAGRFDDDVVRRHLRWMSSLDLPALERVMGARFVPPPSLTAAHPRLHAPALTAMALDFATYLPGSVLTKLDRATMAHGLEARAPFLDERVLAIARRTPLRAKIRGHVGKAILRDAARPLLPAVILDRPKHGFSVPLAAWLRGPLAPRLDALLGDSPVWTLLERAPVERMVRAHRARRGDFAKGLWAIYVLDRWMRRTSVHA